MSILLLHCCLEMKPIFSQLQNGIFQIYSILSSQYPLEITLIFSSQLQAVTCLVGRQMGIVMMKTTMKPASLMVGTAVDLMLIQHIALNVNAFAMFKIVFFTESNLTGIGVYRYQRFLHD